MVDVWEEYAEKRANEKAAEKVAEKVAEKTAELTKEMAIALLKENVFTISKIAELTKLSVEEINALQETLMQNA